MSDRPGRSQARSRTVYLGLGSNEGDRLGRLRAAVDLLRSTAGLGLISQSSVYETEPVGEVPDQRDFLNAALELQVSLEPHALLAECKRIERELGRRPGGPRGGPRPVDVDLLLFGDVTVADGRLVLPHPEITRRRFVLEPLLELDPQLRLPDGTALAEALAALETPQRVSVVGRLDRP